MKAFAGLHPAVTMTYFVLLLTVCMFLPHPVLQGQALVCGALTCALLCRRGAARDVGFYLPLFLLVAVTNPLFSHNGVTPLFFLNGNPVTLEALLYGLSLAAMVVGVLLWCKAYNEVMTSDKFLYLFGAVTPKLSLVLSMALRFLPAYRRQARRVSRAQKAMGLYAGSSMVCRVKNRLRVLAAMVTWSLENAMETAASMKARGYGSGKRRTHFSLFRFRPADGAFFAALLLLAAAPLAAAAAGALNFTYYPRLSQLQTTPAAWVAYAAYGLFLLLPAMWEAKEALVWRCCKRKI